MCGKCKPRTRNIKHICRACMTPTLLADRHSKPCPLKTQTLMERLVKGGELQKLKDMSSIASETAFTK